METLKCQSRLPPPTLLTAALASDVYGTRSSPRDSLSDRGVIDFWNAPPSRSLSRVLSCPLPATFARRGWGGRSRAPRSRTGNSSCGPTPSLPGGLCPVPLKPAVGLRTPLGPGYLVEDIAPMVPPPNTHSQEIFLTSASGLGQLEPPPCHTPDPSGDPSGSGAFLPPDYSRPAPTPALSLASAHGPQSHVEGLQWDAS